MAAKSKKKKLTKKGKVSGRKAPEVPVAPPILPHEVELPGGSASQSIQDALAATRRALDEDLQRFRDDLTSVQDFVAKAVGEMQAMHAGALQRIAPPDLGQAGGAGAQPSVPAAGPPAERPPAVDAPVAGGVVASPPELQTDAALPPTEPRAVIEAGELSEASVQQAVRGIEAEDAKLEESAEESVEESEASEEASQTGTPG